MARSPVRPATSRGTGNRSGPSGWEFAGEVSGGALGVVLVVGRGDGGEVAGALICCPRLHFSGAEFFENFRPDESHLAVASNLEETDATGPAHPAHRVGGGLQAAGKFDLVDDLRVGEGGCS